MFLSYVLSFFKKDDTIHGGHYFKGNMVFYEIIRLHKGYVTWQGWGSGGGG